MKQLLRNITLIFAFIGGMIPAHCKYLVVSFSRSGNTDLVAEAISRQTDADWVKINPAVPYPADYNETLARAREEISDIENNGIYPSIEAQVNSLSSYRCIFICTPLWYGGMSTPMQSFLHTYNKEISQLPLALAVTSSSSGISGVLTDLKRLCPTSPLIGDALWVRASQVGDATTLVEDWLATLDLPETDTNPEGTIADAVDLGLSVKWASHNLGADAEEHVGGYYGWGDPTGEETTSDVYDSSRQWTSQLYGGPNPPSSICGTTLDVATAKWGEGWRMPTEKEIKELESLAKEWIEINGMAGYRFTASNGNNIFLPAAGSRLDDAVSYAGTVGYYWSGTIDNDPSFHNERAWRMYIGHDNVLIRSAHRYRGQSIRPVYDESMSGIEPILLEQMNSSDNRIFDLTGRQLKEKPQKGFYIQNGKKYIIR